MLSLLVGDALVCPAADVSLLYLQSALRSWTHHECPRPYAPTTVITRVCPHWGRQVPRVLSIHPPPLLHPSALAGVCTAQEVWGTSVFGVDLGCAWEGVREVCVG